MPALPLIYRRDAANSAAAAPADTRIIDARALADLTLSAARSLATHTRSTIQNLHHLVRRQYAEACDAGYIPACYQGLNAGPSPSAVVGIVLGSVAGFILLLWLLWILSNGTTFIRTSTLEEEDVVVRRRRRERSASPRSSRGNTRRSARSSYAAEMRHTSPRRERVIRQERIVREVPPQREASRMRETIVVEESRPERRVDGDDVIEVVEEHSSIDPGPPRRKGRRSSGYR